MDPTRRSEPNVRQAVPFFMVSDIQASLSWYVDGLGFAMTNHWSPEGKLTWCALKRGGAEIMLQEFATEAPGAPLGLGVSICFMCDDALAIYHEAISRGLTPSRPFVGNRLWVTSFVDPDGYRLDFESPTDAPEETVYQDPAT